MCKSRLGVALLFALLCGAGVAQAQSSMPLYTVSYQVQVKYEMWRNGNSYWATEYETANLAEAQMVFALFEAAFDAGELGAILGSGFDWIPVDLRLKTKYTWNLQREDLQLAPTSGWQLSSFR
ncbi:MAG: hypothetical protein NXI32_13215 [bacterium]|nr:hypothetical protein [bacterium]